MAGLIIKRPHPTRCGRAQRRRRVGLGWIGALVVGVSACASGAGADAGSPAGVQALIGDAACTSDAQCATIGVGARACGGPAAYLPWSRLRTDEPALRRAADQDAAKAREKLGGEGRLSICAMLPDPGAICRVTAAGAPTGRCVLRSPAGAEP